MVAQFPEIITIPTKNLTPIINIDVNTYILFDSLLLGQSVNDVIANRMCFILINISNIKKTLSIATFSRIFAYAQSLANSSINPVSSVNQSSINTSNAMVNNPQSSIKLSIDASEAVSVCVLSLKVNNLRLDYMDEYFNSTLEYLTNAIASDLNPDV